MSRDGIRPVYMDNAATTPLAPSVFEAMLPFLQSGHGNPSSVHRLGRIAKGAVEDSRNRIAAHLSAEPEEIIFTSGATESNNLALSTQANSGHLVTSSVEHKAILEPAEALESNGTKVTYLSPNPNSGKVTEAQIAAALTPDTGLVSIMYVNNETGTVAPLHEISLICKEQGIPMHTDAAQAAAWFPLNCQDLGVDMMSLSAHKIHGPKGIGILFVKNEIDLAPMILGGSQERGRRGGTENVAGAVGMATAMDLVAQKQSDQAKKVQALRQQLQTQLYHSAGDQLVVNTPEDAAPHILNIAFKPVDEIPLDGEMLLLNLDIEGICASAGSACTSGAITPSHVLLAMGVPEDTARASLRLSLSRYTSQEDIERTVACIVRVVRRMRGRRQNEG